MAKKKTQTCVSRHSVKRQKLPHVSRYGDKANTSKKRYSIIMPAFNLLPGSYHLLQKAYMLKSDISSSKRDIPSLCRPSTCCLDYITGSKRMHAAVTTTHILTEILATKRPTSGDHATHQPQ
jgi:hypothetical protein